MSSGLASRGMKAGAREEGSGPEWLSKLVDAIFVSNVFFCILYCGCLMMRSPSSVCGEEAEKWWLFRSLPVVEIL